MDSSRNLRARVKNLLPPAVITLLITLFVLGWTRLIPKWGLWYSNHLPFRWQTEQMLHGKLALAESASGMAWDLAWGGGRVEQLWGLGVPLLRLPFDFLAKLVGQVSFPDRLTFLFAFILVTFIVVKFHIRFSSSIWKREYSHATWIWLFPTILFPPFLTLCASRFLNYEEVEAYGFLLGLLLITLTAWLFLEPVPGRFYMLALLSGFTVLVRPTLGVYGVASVLIGAIPFIKSPNLKRVITLGGFSFASGGLLLMITNTVRFGAPLEFGHSLATNSIDTMGYCTRFQSPFHNEPLVSAAKDLFGFLFRTGNTIGVDSYNQNIFPGQSNTFRWREIYFSTYDVTLFAMLVVVYAWLAFRIGVRVRKKELLGSMDSLEVMSLWSALATLPLLIFYLRFPFMSSRYMLDFGPAFAAGAWVFWCLLARVFYNSLFVRSCLLLAIIGWWGFETLTAKTLDVGGPMTQEAVIQQMDRDRATPLNLPVPDSYSNGYPFDKLRIPFNGMGWFNGDGKTEAYVLLYVDAPQCLVLKVAKDAGTNSCPDDYECIQAKIGLDFLKRDRIVETAQDATIVFDPPANPRLRKGIQQAAITFMPAKTLRYGFSNFRLLSVKWRDGGDQSKQQ